MNAAGIVIAVCGITLAPLLQGVVTRVKAKFGGRTGAPLLQPYFDLLKLLRKGAVYSRTTTWVFVVGPVVSLAAALLALLVTPLGAAPSVVSFGGDFILLAGLLALGRFATMISALDTGSAFEGMGASREGWFAVFAEPALLLGLAVLARHGGDGSLSGMYGSVAGEAWRSHAPALAMLAAAFFAVFLAENSRIPVDDPTTHLELTMIHEVMVLDHGGVDFGLIEYAAALKFWVLGALVSGLLLPLIPMPGWLAVVAGVAAQLVLAMVVGVVESVMARLRLAHVPLLMIGAGALAVVVLMLTAGGA